MSNVYAPRPANIAQIASEAPISEWVTVFKSPFFSEPILKEGTKKIGRRIINTIETALHIKTYNLTCLAVSPGTLESLFNKK